MNIDLDKLEKTALAARQGEWEWEIHDASMATLVACEGDVSDRHVMSVSPCGNCRKVETENFFGRCTLPSEADANFVAAFNPKVVLELIRQLKDAKREGIHG